MFPHFIDRETEIQIGNLPRVILTTRRTKLDEALLIHIGFQGNPPFVIATFSYTFSKLGNIQ